MPIAHDKCNSLTRIRVSAWWTYVAESIRAHPRCRQKGLPASAPAPPSATRQRRLGRVIPLGSVVRLSSRSRAQQALGTARLSMPPALPLRAGAWTTRWISFGTTLRACCALRLFKCRCAFSKCWQHFTVHCSRWLRFYSGALPLSVTDQGGQFWLLCQPLALFG